MLVLHKWFLLEKQGGQEEEEEEREFWKLLTPYNKDKEKPGPC